MATTTAVTPNGTEYTIVSTVVPVAGTVYYAVATASLTAAAIPTILYTHGNGGGANQFTTLAAWAGMRAWLIDNGWAWIETTGGGASSWGNQAARDSYEAGFTFVDGILDIGDVVVLGRSMGGFAAYWLATLSPVVAPRSVGFIINSGTTDLAYRYSIGDDAAKEQLRSAFGAVDDADFATKTAGFDPMLFPLSTWDGVKVLQLVGTADDNVLPGPNAYAIRARWAGRPALDRLDVRQGGDHSGGNGSYLQVAAMSSFLETVTGAVVVPEPVPTVYVIAEMYLIDSAGNRRSVSPR